MTTGTTIRERPDSSPAALGRPRRAHVPLLLAALCVAAVVLTLASLFVGGYDIRVTELLHDQDQARMFLISRIPRTLALIFAATAMSVSGVIMQMITQNRFVEPTTAGTSDWAGLGILLTLILWPAAPVMARMVLASICAFVGTMVFLAILRRIAVRNSIVVPLAGIMLGAVVGAISTFLAGRFDLLQSMSAWRSGGFSSIVEGFYEPLWAVAAITLAAWIAADRFTVAGLGEETSTNLGVNYHAVVLLGTALVALATGITSVVVGFIPFLGLVVPNLVSMLLGDDLRRNLPWVALTGTVLLLICDLVGRTIVAPMEIPASVILGVVGAVVFVAIVVRSRSRVSA
ncbi:ABC transporter permease [Mobilicoccus massiliensis]|uniref:ABC transporter permease n=1 Tax=Mobilicoccus massiliensis TaxID=1522310 RepID=UPI0009E2E797|nr:iron chelate uptake ABC transporter family permease subunit [Mobilicoccus massiliensis]